MYAYAAAQRVAMAGGARSETWMSACMHSTEQATPCEHQRTEAQIGSISASKLKVVADNLLIGGKGVLGTG